MIQQIRQQNEYNMMTILKHKQYMLDELPILSNFTPLGTSIQICEFC
jgi:hypothetical protein